MRSTELRAGVAFLVAATACAASPQPVVVATGAAPDLSGRFESADKLIVVHHPAGVTVTQVEPHVVLVYLGAGAAATLRVDPAPSVQGVDALTREPSKVVLRNGTRERTACHGGLPGLRRTGTLVPPDGAPERGYWECAFFKNGRLFTFSYAAPRASLASVAPLLEHVIAATEAR